MEEAFGGSPGAEHALALPKLKATVQQWNSKWAHVVKGDQTQPATPTSGGPDQSQGQPRANRLICPSEFAESDAPTDTSATYLWADDLLLPADHSKEFFV